LVPALPDDPDVPHISRAWVIAVHIRNRSAGALQSRSNRGI
jgi:hypothetical protein